MFEGESDQQQRKRRRGSYKCYVCQRQGVYQCIIYPSVYALKRHIFATHLHEKGFSLTCGIGGCPVVVLNRRNLYDHVRKYHPGCEWIPGSGFDSTSGAHEEKYPTDDKDISCDATAPSASHNCNLRATCNTDDKHEHHLLPQGMEAEDIFPSTSCDTDHSTEDEDDDVILFKQMISLNNEQRQISTALSLAQLKANYNLSQAALEAVQLWTVGLLSTLAKTIIGGVKLNSSTQTSPTTSSSLDEVFELGKGMASPFHGLNSECGLMNVLKDKLGYVEPETVILLEDPDGGVGDQPKVHSMQYVPLVQVLKLLYRDRKFRSELSKRKPSTDGVMTDFMDGTYFKNHPLFTKNPEALQLQLYYDGFEGSKIQKHNIGAIYFSILNLHPAYRSTIKNICLTAFVFEKDIKHPDIGWEVILGRFNADLKKLEDGIHFTVDGEDVFVQGTIAQMALDNKAAHSVFGLQDCFYGETMCISRYCHCTTADIQDKALHKECEVRSRQSFERDLAITGLSGQPTNGIRSRCYIGSRYFHCAEAFAADIHHDVMEGLIPGLLKPILQELIRKQLFTIHQLNRRVANFDYNAQDAKNRPSVITEAQLREDSRSLKQYAAQYWCLLRMMPLIIGDKIPEDDELWLLLIQLIDVVDLIMSPRLDAETLSYLEMQLLVLFKDFRRQFPNVRLTPEMHHTVHYPRLMREVGPLIWNWVVRYEVKQHFSKPAAVHTGNFTNVAKTLAVKHQMLQAVHVAQGGLLNKEVVLTDGHPECTDSMENGAEIFSFLNCSKVFVCKKVTIHGTDYTEGDAILTGFSRDGIVEIGEINHIVSNSTHSVCFVVSMFDVLGYDEHFHSWKMERLRKPTVTVTRYSSLPDHHHVGIHSSFGDSQSLYASFRYNVILSHQE